ncbi:transglycosylase SLT domain-containing protein [Candidatus Woesearchaeota archaeon]|nr:transglycosylase SLT domain-containing protein [Candidatus Woesearchaeota archaeon]
MSIDNIIRSVEVERKMQSLNITGADPNSDYGIMDMLKPAYNSLKSSAAKAFAWTEKTVQHIIKRDINNNKRQIDDIEKIQINDTEKNNKMAQSTKRFMKSKIAKITFDYKGMAYLLSISAGIIAGTGITEHLYKRYLMQEQPTSRLQLSDIDMEKAGINRKLRLPIPNRTAAYGYAGQVVRNPIVQDDKTSKARAAAFNPAWYMGKNKSKNNENFLEQRIARFNAENKTVFVDKLIIIETIDEVAKSMGIGKYKNYLIAKACAESWLDQKAVSKKDAVGIFQLTKDAIDEINRIDNTCFTIEDISGTDGLYLNIYCGIRYFNILKSRVYLPSIELVSAAFNWGEGNLRRLIEKSGSMPRKANSASMRKLRMISPKLPKDTREYITTIKKYEEAFEGKTNSSIAGYLVEEYKNNQTQMYKRRAETMLEKAKKNNNDICNRSLLYDSLSEFIYLTNIAPDPASSSLKNYALMKAVETCKLLGNEELGRRFYEEILKLPMQKYKTSASDQYESLKRAAGNT